MSGISQTLLRRAALVLRLLLLVFALASLADDGNEGEDKIKVLIVEGVTNHAWEKRLDIVRAILAKDGSDPRRRLVGHQHALRTRSPAQPCPGSSS
jgi:hypothetical protein